MRSPGVAVPLAGPVLVTVRPACEPVVTTAVLLSAFGSGPEADTVAVLVRLVGLTGGVTTTSKVSVAPTATVGAVQLTCVGVFGPGPLHVNESLPPVWLTELKVAPGKESVRVTAAALAGPRFVTVMVYVIGLPEVAGSCGGLGMRTHRSAWLSTVVVAVDELFPVFGSDALLVTLAVFVIVEPLAAPALTWTTRSKIANWDTPRSPVLQTTVVTPLAFMVEQLKLGAASLVWPTDTNVVPWGTTSVSDTFGASVG